MIDIRNLETIITECAASFKVDRRTLIANISEQPNDYMLMCAQYAALHLIYRHYSTVDVCELLHMTTTQIKGKMSVINRIVMSIDDVKTTVERINILLTKTSAV